MAEKFTKEQIFDELKKILVEELEINDGDIAVSYTHLTLPTNSLV